MKGCNPSKTGWSKRKEETIHNYLKIKKALPRSAFLLKTPFLQSGPKRDKGDTCFISRFIMEREIRFEIRCSRYWN